jgi:hypothetical protein
MQQIEYMIYHTNISTGQVSGQIANTLSQALAMIESTRKQGHRFVTLVSEHAQLVGAAGADGVEQGLTPDGEIYSYTKTDALSQRTRVYAPGSDDSISADGLPSTDQ